MSPLVAGAHWDCNDASNYFGWESDKKVIVWTDGDLLMELLTRAKTMLYILLVNCDSKTKAAEQGLVEIK